MSRNWRTTFLDMRVDLAARGCPRVAVNAAKLWSTLTRQSVAVICPQVQATGFSSGALCSRWYAGCRGTQQSAVSSSGVS